MLIAKTIESIFAVFIIVFSLNNSTYHNHHHAHKPVIIAQKLNPPDKKILAIVNEIAQLGIIPNNQAIG